METYQGSINTWEDFDEEKRRRSTNISSMESKLDRAREQLAKWINAVGNHLEVTVGRRDKE